MRRGEHLCDFIRGKELHALFGGHDEAEERMQELAPPLRIASRTPFVIDVEDRFSSSASYKPCTFANESEDEK